ncbi:GPW/gp25 family protein [Jatrophihabitans cynanchi]|jgi:phage baseplate assembly protein W|uniref:GPW/gp25 family protein n=1 Tax=Jatrophihabitans cynanchi TaxID=2944128 RepID=A0ABY7JYT8_9ACTN|nr:GPW/gp25 family protein [Jatrophihabitans sp. SB3-54]WAX57730.1 GPW/gp25 family protein [Jatrophihabitans sp. SB3-54]
MADNLPIRPEEPTRYDATFVGRGFSWPMEVDHTGSIRLTDTVEDIDRSMRIVLMTAPGERVMRPRFGCDIWDLLFEPVTPNLLGLIASAVYEALGQWEPRVQVDEVVPVPDVDDGGLVRVTVTYHVKATNDRRNLVFPFYVIPHETE